MKKSWTLGLVRTALAAAAVCFAVGQAQAAFTVTPSDPPIVPADEFVVQKGGVTFVGTGVTGDATFVGRTLQDLNETFVYSYTQTTDVDDFGARTVRLVSTFVNSTGAALKSLSLSLLPGTADFYSSPTGFSPAVVLVNAARTTVTKIGDLDVNGGSTGNLINILFGGSGLADGASITVYTPVQNIPPAVASGSIFSISVTAVAVPEPSSVIVWSVLGATATCVGLGHRRKAASKVAVA